MKKINWNILVLFLIIIIGNSSLEADNNVLEEFSTPTQTWHLYKNIIGGNSTQKLSNIFEVADSLLFNDNPDSSLDILQKAYQDTLFSNYSQKREILFKMYDVYSYQWDFSKSIPLLKKIFVADSLLTDSGLMAHSSLWLASTYLDNNDYDNASAWIKKSRLYSTEVDSTRIIAYLYMLEGDIYASEQDFLSAFQKYSEADKYTNKFPISNTTALIKLSLATIYSSLDQNDVALKYYLKTVEIYNQLQDYSGSALAIYNIAISYGNSGDYDKALQYALESIEVCQKEENKYAISDMLASCYSLTSQLYERKEKWDLSLKYLKLSDELVNSNTSMDTSVENINQYVRFYSKLNDYENAQWYVNLGIVLKQQIITLL